MKRLNLIAIVFFLLPLASQAKVGLADLSQDQVKEYTRLIRNSPILQGVARGIQKQYGSRCAPLIMKSFFGDDSSQGTFVAQMVCFDQRSGMQNTGLIVTVQGFFLPEEPVGIQQMTIQSAG